MEKLTFNKFIYIIIIVVIPTLFGMLYMGWKDENIYLKTKIEALENDAKDCSANLNQIIVLKSLTDQIKK